MGASAFTRRVFGAVACGAVAVGMAACDTGGDGTPDDADLVAGKEQFVQKCGSCHTMERAGTKGTQGPNLDEAFDQALDDGFGRGGVRGIVGHQIEYPAREIDPKNTAAYMPADLVTGPDVDNVAAYVAYATNKTGKDPGRLATAGAPEVSNEPIAAKGGTLAMPADPNGQLIYASTMATAMPGQLTINSKNDADIPHDIALTGNGVNEKGEVVQGGATSTLKATVQAGKYTYFCSVPGHREGGMEGTLTVK